MTTTEKVEYTHGDGTFEVHVALPDGDGPAPAVVLCHAWAGQGDFERGFAEELAAKGYVGVAHDVYGKGVYGQSKEENQALMTPLASDRAYLYDRLATGLKAVLAHPRVDAGKVAVAGFCFGGLCALDVARRGTDVAGAISFHGILGAPDDAPAKDVKAKVLALHGYDDPMAPPEALTAFASEMTAGGADWQILAFGNTKHSFTTPGANDPEMGLEYSASADRRARQAMHSFLAEIFS
jgi:dienelactone hydrolase